MIEQIMAHAAQCQPLECCGLIVRDENGTEAYRPCRNTSIERDHFVLHPADWADAEDAGEVIKVVHSHVYRAPVPSDADRVGCAASGLPWLIVSWPTGQTCELILPDGFEAPLLGREFVWGIFDCFTLIRDYYRRELGLLIDDCGGYPHNFVELGDDLYLARYLDAGFVEVDAPAQHDILLMQIGATSVTGHAAIYLGDETILHHLQGRLSCRHPYGGAWRSSTRKVLRHASRC